MNITREILRTVVVEGGDDVRVIFAGEQGPPAAITVRVKLTAGPVIPTPESGVLEFDGTNLFFTVGSIRKTVTLT